MEAQDDDRRRKERKRPFRVRLPGFLVDKEVGLGDVIKRATTCREDSTLRWLPTASSRPEPLDGLSSLVQKIVGEVRPSPKEKTPYDKRQP